MTTILKNYSKYNLKLSDVNSHTLYAFFIFWFLLLSVAPVAAEQPGTPLKQYKSAFATWADFRLGIDAAPKTPPQDIAPKRTFNYVLDDILRNADTTDTLILEAKQGKEHEVIIDMDIRSYHSTPLQIGRAARITANTTNKDIEKITIRPSHMGLEGPNIELIRRDFERAVIDHQGSPQEIWHNAEITQNTDYKNKPASAERSLAIPNRSFDVVLEEHLSLVRADQNILSRSSVLGRFRQNRLEYLNLVSGTDVRLNLFDNFNELDNALPDRFLPVRSDIDDFTDKFISLDRLYTAWLGQAAPDVYISLIGGYPEEQYQTYGGEILWRPFHSEFAFGAETYLAFKRDPQTFLNLGLTGDSLVTGHLKAYYEPFDAHWRFGARAGRYLAEDIGATVSADYMFKNGAQVSLYSTYTDSSDFGVFGDETHFDAGLRVSFPIDGMHDIIPYGSHTRVIANVVGRDTGQFIDTPIALHDVTRPLSKRHITQHWMDILE